MGIEGITGGIAFPPTEEGSELARKVAALLKVYTIKGVGSLYVNCINDPSYGEPKTIQISPQWTTSSGPAWIENVYLSLLSSPEGKVVRATPEYLDLWFKEERYRIRYNADKSHHLK